MGMEIGSRLGEQIGRYLDLATDEIKLTAANMANIDTPGYRTIGIDFEAEMRRAIAGVDQGTDPAPVRAGEVDGLIARPDGNNVSMDRESESGRGATEVQDRRGPAEGAEPDGDGCDPCGQVEMRLSAISSQLPVPSFQLSDPGSTQCRFYRRVLLRRYKVRGGRKAPRTSTTKLKAES
jgi:flagellar basal-body rod protein FlgB